MFVVLFIDLFVIFESQCVVVFVVLREWDVLQEINWWLEYLIVELNQVLYGKCFEKLNDDECQLVFEDLEIVLVEVEIWQDVEIVFCMFLCWVVCCNCGYFLESLFCVECVIELSSLFCLCGCGEMYCIGEDWIEWLDIVFV